MLWLLFASMTILLLLSFPMMVALIVPPLAVVLVYFPTIDPMNLTQQMLTGVKPLSLVAIPMFIFAADIITSGQAARRLTDLVLSFLGHIRGGLAITSVAACTVFGAVSGSCQATVVAIGGSLRPRMMEDGYSESFATGLIINSAGIALLIPPSIAMIIYGVVTGTSVGELFIAGVGPGLLVFLLFSIYCYFAASRMNIKPYPKSTIKEKLITFKKALLSLGFPVVVLGTIYTGIASPTEASALAVLYAFIVEVVIYRNVKIKDIYKIALNTGLVTGVVFILLAMGAVFSWIVSFAKVPDKILPQILGSDPTAVYLMLIIAISYFIACMFVDSIVAIMILSPIFHPQVQALGLDPVLIGIIVTMQSAIGAVSPPFGCNIFTAMAVFRQAYFSTISRIWGFLFAYILAVILIIFFPNISLFLRDLAYGQ
ncbi:MAG: TRAP transporter large permease [Deltaproteobacteria bacterium]|jgi:tripartite ATP-independent transporter DctM subunit|nr:TRAP transporter large permease [Deltaproteobacteria bacterium]